jgi:hypothetical protein
MVRIFDRWRRRRASEPGSELAHLRDLVLHYERPAIPPEPEWYGIGNVVRDLAGLPRQFPLALQIHHGPHIDEAPLDFYNASPLPLLACRREIIPLHTRRPGKLAMAIGTPQVHYRRMNRIERRPDAAGTLAFPCHSSHHVEARFDDGAYAKALRNLPAALQPAVVCVYWRDLMAGRHRPYLDEGLRVVSAGHMFDPDFIARLYGYLPFFRYVTGNEVGTHAILALEMGIPYFHLGERPRYVDLTGGDPTLAQRTPGKVYEYDAIMDRSMSRRLYALLPGAEAPAISEELAEFVRYLHGCDEPLDCEALRRFIVDAALAHDEATAAIVSVLSEPATVTAHPLMASGGGP